MADNPKDHPWNIPHPTGGSTPADPAIPAWVAVPDLSMAWAVAPDINGTVPGASGQGDSSSAVPQGPTMMSMPTIQGANEQVLALLQNVVSGYNALHDQVNRALDDPGFWGENAMYQGTGYTNNWNTPGGGQNKTNDGGLGTATGTFPDTNVQTMAKNFDQYIRPGMGQALRAAADTITMLGVFMSHASIMANMVAAADKASILPPPGTLHP